MADTKLTRTKVPNMKGKKSKKLGLITSDKRRMVAFKLDPYTIVNLAELVEKYKKSFFYSLTKTDILEVALRDFLGKSENEHLELLQKFGRNRDRV